MFSRRENILSSIDTAIKKKISLEKVKFESHECPSDSEISKLLHTYLTCWLIQHFRKIQPFFNLKKKAVYDYDFYYMEVVEVLELYAKSLRIPIKVQFHKKVNNTTPESKRLIDEYTNNLGWLKFSSFEKGHGTRYFIDSLIDIKDISDLSNKRSIGCDCDVPNHVENTDFITCTNCGERIDNLSIKLNHGDSKRTNITQKNLYDKKIHFLDCINQFQGTQMCMFDKILFSDINTVLEKYGLVDKMQEGTKRYHRVEKEHIRLVLKEIGISKQHYENINVIYSKITNNPLPNIEHLKDKLLEDFDVFSEKHGILYPEVEKRTFKYQHLLFQLLCRHKFSCKRSDFNFLKTTERRVQLNSQYKHVFEALGWNHTSIF